MLLLNKSLNVLWCINIFFFCVWVPYSRDPCPKNSIDLDDSELPLPGQSQRSFDHVTTKPDWASIVWRRSLCAIKEIVPRCKACIYSFVHHIIFSLPFSFVSNLLVLLYRSQIRQIPDNQEVFVDADTEQSLIIELLDLVPEAKEEEIAK